MSRAGSRKTSRPRRPRRRAVGEPAVAEGGDLIRLDERTLLAGRGYRTSPDGIQAVSRLLPGAEVHVFDLPHWHGESEVMHLLSLLSPLDADLVVAYPPLLPVALAQLLAAARHRDRAGAGRRVPDHGHERARARARVALALDGNPVTRSRLEAAGVTVLVCEGSELSVKGDGGPTCLTMPLWRD